MFLYDLGVDGLFTDYPDIAVSVRDKYFERKKTQASLEGIVHQKCSNLCTDLVKYIV